MVRRQLDEAAAVDHELRERMTVDALLFLYTVIFIHRLDVRRKEYVFWLQMFSAAILPDITRCSAIAERPRCRVRYSFRQK